MAKSPPPPEFDVALVSVPNGRMTAVWWEWLQRYVRWDEACCEAGGGGGGEGGAVTEVTGTAPVVVTGTALLTGPETQAAGSVNIAMPPATGSANGYLRAADWTTFNNKAPLANPFFTGNPQAPTPTAGDSDTSIATTGFVTTAVAAIPAGPVGPQGPAGATGPAGADGAGLTNGDKGDIVVASSGASLMFDSAVVTTAARTVLDDTTTAAMLTTLGAAPLASPVFTGDPQAPTAALGDADTSIATTAFVSAAVSNTFAGGMSTAEYTYSTTTTTPPSTGQLRANTTTQTAITAFYLHETNAVGIDITNALKLITTGVKILCQDKTNAANVQYYVVTGPAVDNGVYFTIPVTWTTGGSNFTAGRVIFAGFGIGSNNMTDAPEDSGEYVRVNALWRKKSQTLILDGVNVATGGPVTVPTGARAVKFQGSLCLGNTTNSLVPTLRASLDGTTMLAGASDYSYAGVYLPNTQTTVTDVAYTSAAHAVLSLTTNVANYSTKIEGLITLTKSASTIFHGRVTGTAIQSTAHFTNFYQFYLASATWTSATALKALSFGAHGNTGTFVDSYMDLEWVY